MTHDTTPSTFTTMAEVKAALVEKFLVDDCGCPCCGYSMKTARSIIDRIPDAIPAPAADMADMTREEFEQAVREVPGWDDAFFEDAHNYLAMMSAKLGEMISRAEDTLVDLKRWQKEQEVTRDANND